MQLRASIFAFVLLGVIQCTGVGAMGIDSLARVAANGTTEEFGQALVDADPATIRSGRFGRGLGLVHAAVANRDHPAVVRLAIEAGADPNLQDNDGRTPLHHAVDADRTAAAKALLDAGVDLTRPNEAGLDPVAFCRLTLREIPGHETCRLVITRATSR